MTSVRSVVHCDYQLVPSVSAWKEISRITLLSNKEMQLWHVITSLKILGHYFHISSQIFNFVTI